MCCPNNYIEVCSCDSGILGKGAERTITTSCWPQFSHNSTIYLSVIEYFAHLVYSPTLSFLAHLNKFLTRFSCCSPFQLLREINRTSVSRALRIRRQASQSEPRAYVTAHFKTLPLEFTLGDSRNYGDFRNRPLQGGQEYVFFVLALLDLSENVSAVSCAQETMLLMQKIC